MSPPALDWSDPKPGFAALLRNRRLALGDPDHVPAGIYAKAALQAIGLWQDLASSVARTANVRAALALIERGEAGLAMVYRSDTIGRPRLELLDLVPDGLHPPIIYPLAIVRDRDRPAVRVVYDFLRGPEALQLFADAGFLAGDGTGG